MSRAGGSSSGAALAVGAALGLGAAAAAALAVALLSGQKNSRYCCCEGCLLTDLQHAL